MEPPSSGTKKDPRQLPGADRDLRLRDFVQPLSKVAAAAVVMTTAG
jgi:hypothetical protein